MIKKIALLTLLTLVLISLSACSPIDAQDNANSPVSDQPVDNGSSASPQDDATPPPQKIEPGKNTVQGNVFIDQAQIAIMESYPIQVSLYLSGNLPTPCHQLQTSIQEPDEQNRINIDVFSTSDPDTMCIQVLAPFEVNISIPTGNLADGTYSVWVNGEKAGEFTYPGG